MATTIHTELCRCDWCHPEIYLADIAADNAAEARAKFHLDAKKTSTEGQ